MKHQYTWPGFSAIETLWSNIVKRWENNYAWYWIQKISNTLKELIRIWNIQNTTPQKIMYFNKVFNAPLQKEKGMGEKHVCLYLVNWFCNRTTESDQGWRTDIKTNTKKMTKKCTCYKEDQYIYGICQHHYLTRGWK